MSRRLIAVLSSVVLLSLGWLGFGGFTVLAGLVPLLWISDSYGDSCRDWWRVFGWSLLTFVLWNVATVWWIWNATPVGPVAATLVSTTLNMLAFMLYHTVSKKAPRALAYTLLVAGWITTEFWYTWGEISFPWLILGNAFSESPWAVQWYEYTGVFGGSLWVLLTNILLYETIKKRSRKYGVATVVVAVVPVLISLGIYFTYKPSERTVKIAVVQPNVDCYDKFHGDTAWQEQNILELLGEVPQGVDFVALPETALPEYIYEPRVEQIPIVDTIAKVLQAKNPSAVAVTGASTWLDYRAGMQTRTARKRGSGYYDIFNSALAITPGGEVDIYHKSRLVIGVEKMPLPWLFKMLEFLVIDLGGTVGQLGVGAHPKVFANGDVRVGPAICYEAVYGDFYGGFVREGADAMVVISNDGWWGNTPGHKRLFAFCRLRAIEHRRAIARSANTGVSGFISERGDDGDRLEWDERGVLTSEVTLNNKTTFYTRYGDYIGRLSRYVAMLCLLYFVAYRVRRKNYLVK